MSADHKIVDSRLSQLIRITQRVGRYLLFGAVVTVLAATAIGCKYFPESTFQLASESRLPKWITLPPGLTRADVSITMSYYITPWGRSAVFILRDPNGKILENVTGKLKCLQPFQLKNPPQGFASGYPAYEEIIIKGTAEMIEHRRPEPIFYITDDPVVWKEHRAIGCG